MSLYVPKLSFPYTRSNLRLGLIFCIYGPVSLSTVMLLSNTFTLLYTSLSEWLGRKVFFTLKFKPDKPKKKSMHPKHFFFI